MPFQTAQTQQPSCHQPFLYIIKFDLLVFIYTVKILITATHHVMRTGFVSSRHETSRHIVPLWFLVLRFVMHSFAPKKKAKKGFILQSQMEKPESEMASTSLMLLRGICIGFLEGSRQQTSWGFCRSVVVIRNSRINKWRHTRFIVSFFATLSCGQCVWEHNDVHCCHVVFQ